MSEDLLEIKGIGHVLMGLLKTNYQITNRSEFLKATKDKVDKFDKRLQRIWVREQLAAGKPNEALSPELAQAAQCEISVFQHTKRTAVEVEPGVIKAQEECKGSAGNKVETAINRQTWRLFVENMQKKNTEIIKANRDGQFPSIVVIQSSTVPVWLCKRKNWKLLFGDKNLFKETAGPDEVFSDVIGALLFALTHDEQIPPPEHMMFLNPQLEHLMAKYGMNFLKFLTDYYADLFETTHAQFKVSQLGDSEVILFFARHRIEPLYTKETSINQINWDQASADDFLTIFRYAVDSKNVTDEMLENAKKKLPQFIKEFVKRAPQDFEDGRRNTCEALLRMYNAGIKDGDASAMKQAIADLTPAQIEGLIPIMVAERGPIAFMVEVFGLKLAEKRDEKVAKALIVLIRDSIIDLETLDEAQKLKYNDTAWPILFDTNATEKWKRRLMFIKFRDDIPKGEIKNKIAIEFSEIPPESNEL